MEFTDTQIATFVQQYFLPSVRIGVMLMVMPVIGARIVSPRVRLALTFLVTLVVVPMLPPLPIVPALSITALLFVVQEVLLGAAIGFSFQVFFQMFVLAGQFMAMKLGLGFASMNDPANGVQTTVLSQFFLTLVTVMFVSIDGHLVLLALMVESFQTLQPGNFYFTPDKMMAVVQLSTWLFSASLLMSLPVLTALLLINLSFGVMSRAAPQLNIFSVGFPFTLICGMALIWIGLSNFAPVFQDTMDYAFSFVKEVLELP